MATYLCDHYTSLRAVGAAIQTIQAKGFKMSASICTWIATGDDRPRNDGIDVIWRTT